MDNEPDLVAENDQLRDANAGLRQVIRRQAAELDALRADNAELKAQVEALTGQVAELQRRLGRNSSNLSMPPSAEGPAKKPAVPRQRGARKPGKQPGAPGAHLAQTDDPNEVVVHAPRACQGCGGDLGDAPTVGQIRRQVFDLPAIRLRVVEHQAQRRVCGCGQVTTAAFPPGATAPACYGPGVRAAIAYLQTWQHLPVDRAAGLLGDLVGAPIATGTIANVVGEAAEVVTPAVAEIADQIAAAPVAHFDETSARVAGRGHWVHVAATDTLAHFHVHAIRGKDGMDPAGILPRFCGVAAHDCFAPYDRYNQMTHQLCGAHLLRDLTAVAEMGEEQDWAQFMGDLLRQVWSWVKAAKAEDRDRLAGWQLASLNARYDGHIAQGLQANPPPPGKQRATGKPAALVQRLRTRRADILRFAVDFAVPFDNNAAERDLRMIKLQTKISGGWRTLTGAQAFCKMRSYIATARKQRQPILGVLRQAFNGQPWMPAPASQPLAAAA